MVDGIMGLHPKNQVKADVDRPNIMEDNTEGDNTLVENDSVHVTNQRKPVVPEIREFFIVSY